MFKKIDVFIWKKSENCLSKSVYATFLCFEKPPEKKKKPSLASANCKEHFNSDELKLKNQNTSASQVCY